MNMAAVSLYDPAVLFFPIISFSFSFINCFIKLFICFMYALFKKREHGFFYPRSLLLMLSQYYHPAALLHILVYSLFDSTLTCNHLFKHFFDLFTHASLIKIRKEQTLIRKNRFQLSRIRFWLSDNDIL